MGSHSVLQREKESEKAWVVLSLTPSYVAFYLTFSPFSSMNKKKLPISLHPHPHSPAPTEANGGGTLPSIFARVPTPNPNTTLRKSKPSPYIHTF